MKNKCHWSLFLIDGRYIFENSAYEYETINHRIKKLESDLNRERKNLEFKEEEIFDKARKDYTIEEITEAKLSYRKQQELF